MKSLSRIMKGPDEENLIRACDLFADFTIVREEPEPESGPEEEPKAAAGPTAEEIRKKAERKARIILEEAREQARLLREEAYEEGMATGKEDGFREAYREQREILDRELRLLQRNIADVVQEVTIEKEKILERYLDDLKRTVLAIAEKIIHTSLKSSGDIIKRMILSATDKMKKRQWAKIYVTKCNTSIAMEADVEFLEALSQLSDNVKIVTMDNGEEGTCIIELPDEIIDASVSTQIENIKDILNNARV